MRIEQLYPYPEARLTEILRQYSNLQQLIWAQEEPENQGAWLFMVLRLYKLMAKLGKTVDVQYAGRETAAAPACGSPYLHAKQQAELVQQALGL